MSSNTVLRILGQVDKEADFQVMANLLPEISSICSNKYRAAILHLLINAPETMHSKKVEEISFSLGIRPTITIHHLEKLEEWKLVDVKKSQKFGQKERRSIWGLDLRYPNWILECYKTVRTHFFTEKQLNELTQKNRNARIPS